MNYSVYDLKQRKSGEVVEVQLSAGANVLLLDSSNYSSFKAGRRHNYYGGLARQTPVRLQIPETATGSSSSTWAGSKEASATACSNPSRRPARASPTRPPHDLEDVAASDPADDLPAGTEEFDLFISHASEDKAGIVRSLVDALEREGVNVWYDEFQLRIGDSLRRKIDAGLARSRFGMVVVSHAFFAKTGPSTSSTASSPWRWRAANGSFPVWHEITKDEVLDHSPSLADKVALSTAIYTVDEIAEEVAAVIGATTTER